MLFIQISYNFGVLTSPIGNKMNPEELKERFFRFAIAIVRFTEKFPKKTVYFIIEKQMIRCSSSSAANYNAACCGKSGADFINKLKIVEEELDETIFWLKYTVGVDPIWDIPSSGLKKEAKELLSIMVASIKTARKTQLKQLTHGALKS